MRYRDTRDNDVFTGTVGRDVFILRGRGVDFVDGGDGFDTVKIDVSGLPDAGDRPYGPFDIDEGRVNGSLQLSADDSIEFQNIERVIYRGQDAGEDLYFAVSSLGADAKAFDVDAGGGVDTLNMYFAGSTAEYFTADDDGVRTSAIGRFSGFEVYDIDFFGGNDVALGSAGVDRFDGGSGDDVLNGGEGDDVLTGGWDADQLTGGAGADRFEWLSRDESRTTAMDHVLDFDRAEGDTIDLSQVDASTRRRIDHFTFIDQAEFSGRASSAYELRQEVNGDGTVTLEGDANRDGIADFAFVVTTDTPLTAADLIL